MLIRGAPRYIPPRGLVITTGRGFGRAGLSRQRRASSRTIRKGLHHGTRSSYHP